MIVGAVYSTNFKGAKKEKIMTKCERYQYGKSFLLAIEKTGNFWQRMLARYLLEFIRKKYSEDCDTDIYHERHIKNPDYYFECCDDLK